MERDGYPADQTGLYGAKLSNFVPGKQETDFIKNCTGDQEESCYGVVASSPQLKTAMGVDVSLDKPLMVDQLQSLLKMKPVLVPSGDVQAWSSCRLA